MCVYVCVHNHSNLSVDRWTHFPVILDMNISATNSSINVDKDTTVTGNNNTIYGSLKSVTGNNNSIFGDCDKITGDNNSVYGKCDDMTGTGNTCHPDISPIKAKQQQQWTTKKRLKTTQPISKPRIKKESIMKKILEDLEESSRQLSTSVSISNGKNSRIAMKVSNDIGWESGNTDSSSGTRRLVQVVKAGGIALHNSSGNTIKGVYWGKGKPEANKNSVSNDSSGDV